MLTDICLRDWSKDSCTIHQEAQHQKVECSRRSFSKHRTQADSPSALNSWQHKGDCLYTCAVNHLQRMWWMAAWWLSRENCNITARSPWFESLLCGVCKFFFPGARVSPITQIYFNPVMDWLCIQGVSLPESIPATLYSKSGLENERMECGKCLLTCWLSGILK